MKTCRVKNCNYTKQDTKA